MSTLPILLGLGAQSRILFLGDGDLALEAALARAGGTLTRSRDGRDAAGASADVAVIGRTAATDAARAAALATAARRALAPGGVLAVEFQTRGAFLAPLLLAYEGLARPPVVARGHSYAAARRLLIRVGFPQVSGFICLPSFADPQVVLPLESRSALAFHFRPPFFPETRQRRLVRVLLRLLAASGLLPGAAPSFIALAARGGGSELPEAA